MGAHSKRTRRTWAPASTWEGSCTKPAASPMRNASIARRSRPAAAIPCCSTISAFCWKTWTAGTRRWKRTKGLCTAIRASRIVTTISRSCAKRSASPGTPSGTWRSIEGWSNREDEQAQTHIAKESLLESDPRRRGASPCQFLRGDRPDVARVRTARHPAWVGDRRTARALSLRRTELRETHRPPRWRSRRVHFHERESHVFQGRRPRVLRPAQVPGLGHPGFRARPDRRGARRRRLGLFSGEPNFVIALPRSRLSLPL